MIFCTLLVSCGDDYEVRKIKIKGRISKPNKTEASRIPSNSDDFTLSDAKKALIFYGHEYDLVNINSDGTFTGSAPEGSATVIAFLTSDNQFIGNLFAGGLNLLPLVGLKENVSVIDLSTLTLEGKRVIPSNDPIGKEIQLSTDEIAFLNDVGSYYEFLSKNIDTNNDGKPDILNKLQIEINSILYMEGGFWGENTSSAYIHKPNELNINYRMRIYGHKETKINLQTIELSGPAGNPYPNIQKDGTSTTPSDGFIAIFSRGNNSSDSGWSDTHFPPFESGIYTLKTNNTDTRTFHYSNVNMRNYMVIVSPTFITNEKGQVTSIKMNYQFPDGSPADPRKLLIGRVRIQINSATKSLYEADNLYGSKNVSGYDYFEKKVDKVVNLSEVWQIGIAYVDLLGNEYEFIWKRPE